MDTEEEATAAMNPTVLGCLVAVSFVKMVWMTVAKPPNGCPPLEF
jgi:hypothetical protein